MLLARTVYFHMLAGYTPIAPCHLVYFVVKK